MCGKDGGGTGPWRAGRGAVTNRYRVILVHISGATDIVLGS